MSPRRLLFATVAAAFAAACTTGSAPPEARRGAASAAPSTSPAAAAGTLDVARFESEIAAFEASDRTSPPPPAGILFVGSSSIRLWKSLAADFPGLPLLNRGFGGSTLREVNHYVPRIVLPYRPRMILLYGGDNEIAAGRMPEQVAGDYREFVRLVRSSLPSTRIVFISVKPSPSRWALIGRARDANRLVREIVATDTLQSFVDVFTPMLGADGRPRSELFVADSLHMTPQGYAIWRERVAPALRQAP